MEAKKPSETAIFSAIQRAAHLFFDGEPRILRDDLALKFIGIPDETTLKSAIDTFCTEMGQQTTPDFASALLLSHRASAVARQRYTEDQLDKAIERGI
jgi:O-methyltransferase involved in polyketide biosynthesis